MTEIGEAAFLKCTSLSSVTLSDSLKKVPDYAFEFCSGIDSITIPNGITTIGRMTFYKCSNLKSVTLPASVDNIDYGAFAYCKSLVAVSEEEPEVEIGEGAFYEVSNAKLYVPKSRENEDWNVYTKAVTTLTKRDINRTSPLLFTTNKMIAGYYHYPVDIPEGVEAYTGKIDDAKTKITLTKVETSYVPACTPVLLYAEAGGQKQLVESSTDAYLPLADNDLFGSIVPVYFGEAGRALTMGSNKTDLTKYCFYKTSGTEVPSNCAFLKTSQVGKEAADKGIDVVFAGTTGLNEAAAQGQTAVSGSDRVYNLDGSYEPNPQKGVVHIVNGEKVIYLK